MFNSLDPKPARRDPYSTSYGKSIRKQQSEQKELTDLLMQKCEHIGKDHGVTPGSERSKPINEQVMFRYDNILGILRESGYDRVPGFEKRSELWIRNEDSGSYLSADTVYRTLVNMKGLDNFLVYLKSNSTEPLKPKSL